MYGPKCGEVLKEQQGVFVCERGQMELSRHMAERLHSCFVAKTEEPEESRFTGHFGGRWFCPGCGVLMREDQPGAVECPKCGRNIARYLGQLVELHPHSGN